MTALAVDIGGSGVRAALVGGDGAIGARHELPLARALPRGELLARVRAAIDGVAPGSTPAAVAVPSFVRPDGTIAECPSLPALEGARLGELLGGSHVVPDLAAAALGESRFGAGRGVSRFLCAALGTGANAAAVVDGALVETAWGCLGDAGHVVVEPDGPPCPCGGRGCLEAVASGFALARDGEPLGLADGAAVTTAARDGHAGARALLERAGTALGRAVASWSAIVWPERVAVAGGVAAAGELLLAPARRELARVGAPYIVGRLELVRAELGRDATLAGAALSAPRAGPPRG